MIRALLDKDPAHLIRFAIVGVTVAALYVMLYVGFLSLGLAIWAANALAFGIAVLVQYVGQTAWTFRHQLAEPGQALRFCITIGLGFVTSAILTGLVGSALDWPSWLAAGIAASCCRFRITSFSDFGFTPASARKTGADSHVACLFERVLRLHRYRSAQLGAGADCGRAALAGSAKRT
jgi:putative flippase GtrA